MGRAGVVGVCVLRQWIVVVSAAALAACGGGSGTDDGAADAGVAARAMLDCMSSVRINEVSREPSAGTTAPSERVRVEVYNGGDCTVDASRLQVVFGTTALALPPGPLEPASFHVLELTRAACTGCSQLRLVDVSQGAVVDELQMPEPAGSIVQAARYPDGSGEMAIQDRAQQSFGMANAAPAVLSRLAETTALRPSDSSPNAILSYGGGHWILGGWSNWAHDVWYSVPKVWRSSDTVSWRSVQEAPPYSPYSAFVVFQDRMWALGPTSYSSTDGMTWQVEPLSLRLQSRTVVFRGAIVAVEAGQVLRSPDGRTWEVLDAAPPWGSQRWEANLLVHRDRLWLIGGEDIDGNGAVTLRNDVWTSADGVQWTRVTGNAAWAPRRWSNAIAYDDKLFVINGANSELWPDEFGNVADIWYSADGVEWLPLQLGPLWGARHASYIAADAQGGFLLSSGYGHGGVSRIYNDVWRFKASMYFPKADGDLFDPRTWGRNPDGSGTSPSAIDEHDALFVFRNRPAFVVDRPFPARSLLVGDGVQPVQVRFQGALAAGQHLYVGGHGTADLCQADFQARHVAPQGAVICVAP